ncbi:MAG TPA: TonB-dependent receptor [Sphingobacteriaceae bacterium]
MTRILLFLFLFTCPAFAQTGVRLTGQVNDQHGQPLAFATVTIEGSNLSVHTDDDGKFGFTVDPEVVKSVTLKVRMVGMQPFTVTVEGKNYLIPLNIVLKDQNLSLSEVTISAERVDKAASNSSVLFDRESIQQLQAFSITDVLNNLPGKTVQPLDLQSPQNIALRSAATDNAAMNNAMGTSIIVDGIAQNNNANMQNKNLGMYGLTGSMINDYENNTRYDVTFGGLDLREIPADNIESIEVITGVAPAKYGDLTDGAILINRQAGKTDYQFSSRVNAGSTNFSLTKGFALGKKRGALNTNFNYLFSNADPRDKMKTYDRISGGLMWTKRFGSAVKNTLAVDLSKKLDNAKQDPDDGRDLLTWSKNAQYSVSNRTSVEIRHHLVRRVDLNLGFNAGRSETYSQWWLNGAPKGVADKDTTGVYEGFYIPGNYTAVDHILGRPVNFIGSLSVSNQLVTGKVLHHLDFGSNVLYSSNEGDGVLFDSERPRFANSGSKNERPYDFQIVPALVNIGMYVEDRFKFDLLSRELSISAGLRYDLQNGFGSWQPRINARYQLKKDLSLNLAYGIATKAPTMAFRYPGPTYFDIPLINYYTGDVRESLLLVYTWKYTPDNSSLRPSKSTQAEAGLNLKKKHFNTSLFGYYKRSEDGFNAESLIMGVAAPEYTYTAVAGQKPTYAPTGRTFITPGLSSSVATNNVNSDNFGLEWLLNTKKIRAIATSISFSTAFNYSRYHNAGKRIVQAAEEDILADKKAWYGIYNPASFENAYLSSRLNTDTHLPRLGFVLSIITDIVWKDTRKSLSRDEYPFAYLDKDSRVFMIDSFDPADPDYGHLVKQTSAGSEKSNPFAYANFSLRVAKEINKKYRFSINAYNFLNLRQRYYDRVSKTLYTYQQPISVGAQVSVKF